MSEWKEITLGDISQDIMYGYTASAKQEPVGPKFLRITDIASGRLKWNTVPYCEISENDRKKYKLNSGDIVIARTGATTGATYTINPRDPEDVVFASYLIRYRINPSIADPFFIDFCLRSSAWKSYVEGISGGSAQPGANAKQLATFEILLPPLPEQKAIASVLSSLDDKIDLLHRQNKTLEAMAETLFRQWFIEEAQEDWEEGKLGDLVNFNYGKTLRDHERSGSGYPVIGSSGIVGFHKDFLVEAPGIVTGRKGTLGVINYLFDNFFPIDTTFYITSQTKSEGLFYEYFLLKSVVLGEMNSDSAVPGLNRNAAHGIPVIIPPDELVQKFNNLCKFNFLKIKINRNQIQTLEKLRDTLLPKLMSGEVRVSY